MTVSSRLRGSFLGQHKQRPNAPDSDATHSYCDNTLLGRTESASEPPGDTATPRNKQADRYYRQGGGRTGAGDKAPTGALREQTDARCRTHTLQRGKKGEAKPLLVQERPKAAKKHCH